MKYFKMLQNSLFRCNIIFKRFAGHSKWANIRHVKGAKDAEKSNTFARLSRQMRVAASEGGSADPNKNLKLSQVIEQCKRFSMPTATIQSILKSCANEKSTMKLHTMDIKGPGNCIILCELYTSNLHTAKQLIASQLKKAKSKLAEGTALHVFHEKGIIHAEKTNSSLKSEELLELATEHAIESNAEDVNLVDDSVLEFTCTKDSFEKTQTILEKLGYKILNSSVEYMPFSEVSLSEAELLVYKKLVGKLEEMPDVVRLFDNVTNES